MKNPFNHENYPSNRIKRNAFPLSFQYNGTFEYGKIYPVGLIRVPNAGTYKIEPTLALNFMPTVFPVQTRQKAYLHFFYGRDRNFWNEYKDFVHGLKPNLVKPYIDEGVTKARTGNLLDYLGVPTTLVGRYANVVNIGEYVNSSESGGRFYSDIEFTPLSDSNTSAESVMNPIDSANSITFSRRADKTGRYVGIRLNFEDFEIPEDRELVHIKVLIGRDANLPVSSSPNYFTQVSLQSGQSLVYPTPISSTYQAYFCRLVELDSDGNLIAVHKFDNTDGYMTFDIPRVDVVSHVFYAVAAPVSIYLSESSGPTIIPFRANLANWQITFDSVTDYVQDLTDETSPYWRSDDTRGKETIKLNAIPCRMYETIYNLYYRNPQNNPYMLNGVPEYNIFTPTLDGGVDDNLYQLRYRNWADDFLTTATQTPQQGIAPLVGLTDRGATITLTNDDGSITRYKTTLDEDGNLTGIETTDSSEPILTQALVDAVTYGISIEDIRNVNKMQKWLELNLRKGYQYKDVIEARWGISISYNELNLPEFIGGFTQEVSMQAVTQTANIDDSVTGQLGWQAGRMYCAKDGREITHYCDEAGYIMVLLSVAPMPNYSQLLPKHWFTRDLLEEYQPEFNHIGFQPITYKEVCPVQAFQESTETNNVLEQTFGYQRPWYEYMSMPDEVHGQFRTTLKDYLINRVFDVKPELSESFLLVDPEQINEVFNVTESDDKILGAINYNIVAKLPISEYAAATIE